MKTKKSKPALERFIQAVAPNYALKRAKARYAISAIEGFQRKYEGASVTKRTSQWITSSTDSNVEIQSANQRLKDRARDLVRNNSHAEKALREYSNFIIGKGIIPSVKTDDKKLNKTAEDILKKWADTTECDADGLNNLYGIQLLLTRSMIESGEVFIRRRYRRSSDKLTIPMQIQVLESDFLNVSKNEEGKGYKIKNGIEYNLFGKITAYHFYAEHPGGIDIFSNLDTKRIPAEDIIHLFRVDRPGQRNGVTWFSPIIIEINDYGDYKDAQLLRQKIAACYVGFEKNMEISDDEDDENDDSNEDPLIPGTTKKLGPNKDMVFSNPPQVNNYGEFSSVSLHSIAAGFGLPYEFLSGDLSQVNYSSIRTGLIPFFNSIDIIRENLIKPRFCDKVWTWIQEAAFLVGTDLFSVSPIWASPKKPQIDPLKENNANNVAVRNGFKSLSAVLREDGVDADDHFREIQKDNKTLDELGLVVDSDPRKKEQSK